MHNVICRLPTQNGLLDYLHGGKGCNDKGIEYLGKEIAYTDILSKHGYYCAPSGKYHIRYDRKAQHSFNHWYTFGSSVYPDAVMISVSPLKGYSTDIFTDGAIDESSSPGAYPGFCIGGC